MFKLLKIIVIILFCGVAGHSHSDVILHAFNWHYNDVENRANDIANAGYRKVLVAPPLKSARWGCAWWQRYQPQDYRVIDHCKGNKQDFVNMIAALNNRGIEVYADIVLNHMANERNGSEDFPGASALSDYAQSSTYWQQQRLFGDLSAGLFSAYDFNQPAQCISDYGNRGDVQWNRLCGGNGDIGLPDLNDNGWVIAQQRAYLQSLKQLGVTGFRLDAAKHMTIDHINSAMSSAILAGMHVFGEVITNGGQGEWEYEAFLKPYMNGTGHGAYDFPLFHQIHSAFGFSGSLSQLVDPGAVGQALPSHLAVTFVLTHDMPNNDGFRYHLMSREDETLAYAYLLGRDGGVPLVYSDHGESGDRDGQRWFDVFNRSDLVAMIQFHNRMQGQQQEVLAHSNCALLFRRGEEGLVGINKCGHTVSFEVSTHNRFKWFRNYSDVMTGAVAFQVTSGTHRFELSPRSWKMWVVN